MNEKKYRDPNISSSAGENSGDAGQPSEKRERIAKRLARAGVASRRDAEAMIAAGRVSVNGNVLASPALNVGASDRIEIDGIPIPAIERTRLFLFHKPAGVVTTNRDPQNRKTVFDVLPQGLPRLLTVGRLDIATEGLLLLTNDGGLSRVLELPSTGWLRRYRVRVHGTPDEDKLAALKDGVAIDGVFYGAVDASIDRIQGSNAWLTIGLREGKNREVRNIMESFGLSVNRLIRISYGPFQLGDLAEGEVREIRGRTLRDQLGRRLIHEAGANFDAPISAYPTEQNPVTSRAKPSARESSKLLTEPGPAIRPTPKWAKDKAGASSREKALKRLQTKSPGMKKGGKDSKDDNDGKPEGTRNRSSHVWMAPGARPQGEKKLQRRDDRNNKPGDKKQASSGGKKTSRSQKWKVKGGADRRR